MIKILLWAIAAPLIVTSGFVHAAEEAVAKLPAAAVEVSADQPLPQSAVIAESAQVMAPDTVEPLPAESEVSQTAQEKSSPPDLAKELSQLKPRKESGESGAAASYSDMVLGLLAVLLLIFGLAWTARRLNVTAMSPSPASLKLQSVLSLGNKEKVVIVNADGRRFLLGVTTNQISILSELDEATESQAGASVANVSFAQQIRQALKQGKLSEQKQAS